MEIVLEWVKEDGFEIRGEAKTALGEMVERLCSANSYAGLKTIFEGGKVGDVTWPD